MSPTTAFCRAQGVAHELEFKRRARDAGQVTYHMHVGLTDWPATAAAVRFVHDELAARGHAIERFGLCLDRAMGLPSGQRAGARRETGPRLEPTTGRRSPRCPCNRTSATT